jgi:hypothetical protein
LREEIKSNEKDEERENNCLSHFLEMICFFLGVLFDEENLIIIVVFFKYF